MVGDGEFSLVSRVRWFVSIRSVPGNGRVCRTGAQEPDITSCPKLHLPPETIRQFSDETAEGFIKFEE